MTLRPPRGGYVLSTLELDASIRLLVGRRARLVIAALISGALGILSGLAAIVSVAVAALAGG